MVSPIDAFANLAAVTNSPPSTIQPRSSATDAVDDRIPDANAPPRDGDPAAAARSSETLAVNRFDAAVEPPAEVRESAEDTEFVATPDPTDPDPTDPGPPDETPPVASGLAAVTAEARGVHVDLAV